MSKTDRLIKKYAIQIAEREMKLQKNFSPQILVEIEEISQEIITKYGLHILYEVDEEVVKILESKKQ